MWERLNQRCGDTTNEENNELSITIEGYVKRSEILEDFISIHPEFKEIPSDTGRLLKPWYTLR
jgi:hypothetical protein